MKFAYWWVFVWLVPNVIEKLAPNKKKTNKKTWNLIWELNQRGTSCNLNLIGHETHFAWFWCASQISCRVSFCCSDYREVFPPQINVGLFLSFLFEHLLSFKNLGHLWVCCRFDVQLPWHIKNYRKTVLFVKFYVRACSWTLISVVMVCFWRTPQGQGGV